MCDPLKVINTAFFGSGRLNGKGSLHVSHTVFVTKCVCGSMKVNSWRTATQSYAGVSFSESDVIRRGYNLDTKGDCWQFAI